MTHDWRTMGSSSKHRRSPVRFLPIQETQTVNDNVPDLNSKGQGSLQFLFRRAKERRRNGSFAERKTTLAFIFTQISGNTVV